MRFDDNPFTCQSEKEDKKAEGSQIWHCSGSFSNDIMAVKGLQKLTAYSKGKVDVTSVLSLTSV